MREFGITHTVLIVPNKHTIEKEVMKSITKLSLVLLTAMAFAALPVNAEDAAPTNAAPAVPVPRAMRFGGTVTAFDATAMTVTLKGRAGDTIVKVTSNTKITKDREPGVFADIKEGVRITGSGKKQDDGTWIANTLRISTRMPAPKPAPATPSSDQK